MIWIFLIFLDIASRAFSATCFAFEHEVNKVQPNYIILSAAIGARREDVCLKQFRLVLDILSM